MTIAICKVDRKHLIAGHKYEVKIDSAGNFRVKDESNKWNKYGRSNFSFDEKLSEIERTEGAKGIETPKMTEALEIEGDGSFSMEKALEDADDMFKIKATLEVSELAEKVRKLADLTVWLGLEVDKEDKEFFHTLAGVLRSRFHKTFLDLSTEEREELKKAIPDLRKAFKIFQERDKMAEFNERLVKYYTAKGIKVSDEKEAEVVAEVKEAPKASKSGGKKEPKKVSFKSFLMSQGIPESMLEQVKEFRSMYGEVPAEWEHRMVHPRDLFRGKDVWMTAISAVLEGKNIMLEGAKATGKNVLADNLAFLFGRPKWDISFHVNSDKDALIGSDTLKDGNVIFKDGAVTEASRVGGFVVLDELNMAKNEAISVMHKTLDDRRQIELDKEVVELHPATRFIGTMNYGYAGTRELNEALISRFVVISVPQLDEDSMKTLLKGKFQGINESFLPYVARIFFDLQKKAQNAEISTRPVDLRGIIDGLSLIRRGLEPRVAFTSTVTNKAFDQFERDIVNDVISTNISRTTTAKDMFSATAMAVDFTEV